MPKRICQNHYNSRASQNTHRFVHSVYDPSHGGERQEVKKAKGQARGSPRPSSFFYPIDGRRIRMRTRDKAQQSWVSARQRQRYSDKERHPGPQSTVLTEALEIIDFSRAHVVEEGPESGRSTGAPIIWRLKFSGRYWAIRKTSYRIDMIVRSESVIGL